MEPQKIEMGLNEMKIMYPEEVVIKIQVPREKKIENIDINIYFKQEDE